MTTYVEIHAIQSVPPSNINRDDTGAPKSAVYGGVPRSRVSSQSWKHAIREDFKNRLDPSQLGWRSKRLVARIAEAITAQNAELADRAEALAVQAMTAAGFKAPAAPKKKKGDTSHAVPETGYLVFLSQRQIELLAEAAVEAADEPDPVKAMRAAKIKALADSEHSVDIALFGRMVADSTDLNVDAACQVAHAISVHAATPEYDYFTAVDDERAANEEETDAGAGMIGTIGFVSATMYRYAAVNVDQLQVNLGDSEATATTLQEFLRSFIDTMPSGKQNSFANGTRPEAVLVTVGQGQPASLVGAFEQPIQSENGYVTPAIEKLATYASEVFDTWRRPSNTYVVGLPSKMEPLTKLGTVVGVDELLNSVASAATRQP